MVILFIFTKIINWLPIDYIYFCHPGASKWMEQADYLVISKSKSVLYPVQDYAAIAPSPHASPSLVLQFQRFDWMCKTTQ